MPRREETTAVGKMATTWKLMKESWQVLLHDRTLVVFPIASSLACFLVFITFVGPFIGVEVMGVLSHRGMSQTLAYAVLFAYYVCNFFVAYLCNAALVDYVVTRTRGGAPTVGGSFRIALSHAPQLALWALLSATVGVVLKALSSRGGLLASIVTSIVGVAWSLVTCFVVPFIVVERKTAFDAVGASKDLLTRTWGQQIVSNVGYGLIGFLLTFPAVVLLVATIVGAVLSGAEASYGAMGARSTIALLAFLYILAVGTVMSTLGAIFNVALYLYTQHGQGPPEISPETLRAAIRVA